MAVGALGWSHLTVHTLFMTILAAGMKGRLNGPQFLLGKLLVVTAGTAQQVAAGHRTDTLLG